MAIVAIQNSDDKTKVNCVKAGAIGALTGYSLKYILPLTPQEKNKKYETEFANTKINAKKAVIEEIKKAKPEGYDTFVKLYESGNLNQNNLSKLDKNLLHQVKQIQINFHKNAVETMLKSQRALYAFTKNIRPTSVFVAAGLFVGSASYITYSLMGKKAKNATDASILQQSN